MATAQRDTGKEFLGAGVAFPFGVDAQGQLAMNSLEDHVRQSILLIAQTGKGERVMRSDFGAGLQALMFSPASPATAALVQQRLRDSLIRYEPRIEVLSITAEIDAHSPETVTVTLQQPGTPDRYNVLTLSSRSSWSEASSDAGTASSVLDSRALLDVMAQLRQLAATSVPEWTLATGGDAER